MTLEQLAQAAIRLWEANPKRQALAKRLNVSPGQVSDEMIRRAECGARWYRYPNMQQIPRRPR